MRQTRPLSTDARLARLGHTAIALAALAAGGCGIEVGPGNRDVASRADGSDFDPTMDGFVAPDAPPTPPADTAPSMPNTCPCRAGTDNFCANPPNTPDCPMTARGGYCDPNGDGSFVDGDWVRGYNEYARAC